jgi:cache 3/cache 2 fusion protein
MRARHGVTGRGGRVMGVMLVWVLAIGLLAMVYVERSHAAVQPADKLDATIFSFDGTDFIRTKTTLVTADGKSAANTKLDHATAAYKALKEKHSYVGEVTVFGHKYDADYAPLVGDDGKLTGALFVGVPK